MNNKTRRGRKLRGLRNAIPLLILLCISGLILILYTAQIASALRSNFVWVNLNAQLAEKPVVANDLAQELNGFLKAIELDSGNRSAWFGLGMSYALAEKIDTAVNIWNKSKIDPVTLIKYGSSARDKGDLDAALAFFRAAETFDSTHTREGFLLAGTICQRAFAMQHLLGESNGQYCSNYLINNGNNLILNGDFSSNTLYGWEGEFFFTGKNAARVQLDEHGESGDIAGRLTGQDESNHFGLFQSLTLSPGDTVRFSGRFRLFGEENLTARLLYISWQTKDGKPQGNHGEQRSTQMNWTEFERTFQVPENAKPVINFYPVNFSGEGNIWFDDIKLEIIHG